MYCKNCGTMLNDNQEFCANCGVKAGGGGRFCQNCGGELMPGANVCEKCGAPVNNPETPPVTPPPANSQQNGAVSGEYLNGKDKTTMAIICFLLGGFGIHNFMMGENKKGIVKIVASLCFGIGYILAIIDFVKILTGSYVVDPREAVLSEATVQRTFAEIIFHCFARYRLFDFICYRYRMHMEAFFRYTMPRLRFYTVDFVCVTS